MMDFGKAEYNMVEVFFYFQMAINMMGNENMGKGMEEDYLY